MRTRIYRFVLVFFLSTAGAFAQNNASLSGNVQDTSGAIIPGASVKLTSQGQGTVRTIQTNEAGLYQFPFLPAGIYDIEVTLPGFKTLVQREITINVAQNVRRDFNLELGNIAENVTVEANVESINTESAQMGAIIDNTKVVEMPLNGRTFYSLATLTPGVAAPLNNQGFRGAFSVAGACQTCNNFTLNGMDNNDPTVAIPNFRPSIDAIQEFNILTGIYGAEYGLGSGGQIIVSTKSGTNQFHGSAYEFLRNSALDARNFFSGPGPIPSFKRNLFGATLGGPIVRNRTFFFYSYEGLRLSQAVTALTTVPTLAMKNGDFSGLLPGRVIRDPLTGQPFPGNIIPPGRMNPVGVDLLKFYPDPTLPTAPGAPPSNNYRFNVPRPERYNQHSVKLDHQLSSRDSFYVTANWYKNNSVETGTGSTCNNTTLPAFPCDLSIKNQVYGISETHIFSPSLINEARFGYTHTYTPSSARNGRIDFWGKYGVKPLLVSFRNIPDKGVPQTSVTGYNGFASSRTFVRDDPHWQISDTLSWTRNKHTMKFGFNLLHYHTGNTDLASQGGTLNFSNTSQGPTSGYALADLLLGYPFSTSNTPYRYRNDVNLVNVASFVQDDWKVTTRLTLNLGLRWEMNAPITDDNNRLTNFDQVKGIPVAQAGAAMDAPLATPVVGFGRRPYDFTGRASRRDSAFRGSCLTTAKPCCAAAQAHSIQPIR